MLVLKFLYSKTDLFMHLSINDTKHVFMKCGVTNMIYALECREGKSFK